MLAHFISNPFIRSETPARQSTMHPSVFLQQPRQLCRGDWSRNSFCQQQLLTYLSFQKWLELKHENNVLFQMTWQERKLMVQVLIKLGRGEKKKKVLWKGKSIHPPTKTGKASRWFSSCLLLTLFYPSRQSLSESSPWSTSLREFPCF